MLFDKLLLLGIWSIEIRYTTVIEVGPQRMRAFEMTLKISLFHLDAVAVVQLNGQILTFLEGRMIALPNMRVVVLMAPQSARTGVHVAM